MYKKEKIPEKLKKILSDNKSGSGFLLSELNSFISANYSGLPMPAYILNEIKIKLSNFQNVSAYLNKFKSLKGEKEIRAFLKDFSQSEKGKYDRIFANAYPLLKKHKTIVTLSNSKTVIEIIKRLALKRNGLKVIVSESRPVCEGRQMAKEFARKKIRVELITEALLPEFVENCGCALIGADKIFPGGDIVNKTGSKCLAILCRHYKKPLFAAADISKLSDSSRFKKEIKNPAEVWKNHPAGVKICNTYFEIVEKEFINKLITD